MKRGDIFVFKKDNLPYKDYSISAYSKHNVGKIFKAETTKGNTCDKCIFMLNRYCPHINFTDEIICGDESSKFYFTEITYEL